MTERSDWQAFFALVLACSLTGCGAERDPPVDVAPKEVSRPASMPTPPPKPPAKVQLVWPTPNDVYFRGGGIERFIQPTVSGDVLSGMFGSVRSGGRQFHEGLDLLPLTRDAKGEPSDPVFAAMPGVVRHINLREGASSYGRYVVLEHPDQSPPVYTLYAHLARVAEGLRVGQQVTSGAVLATMGHSAGGYTIPKERAHLHFEIGVRVTDRFQEWYKARGFGSPNEQGLWNGMNLMGLDPLEFFARERAGGLHSLDEVFAATSSAVTLRIAEASEPDFIRRYPSLVDPAEGATAGWEIDFSATGVPLRWRRQPATGVAGLRPGEVRILNVNTELLRSNRGRKLIETVRGTNRLGDDLRTVLEQLWGNRR